MSNVDLTSFEQYLTVKEVAKILNIGRTTVYLWANQGTFPQPIKFSPQVTRWRLSDIKDWEASRAKGIGEKPSHLVS